MSSLFDDEEAGQRSPPTHHAPNVQELLGRIQDLESKNEHLVTEYETLKASKATLKANRSTQTETPKNRTEAEYESAKNRASELEANIAQLNNASAKMGEQIKELQDKIAAAEKSNKGLLTVYHSSIEARNTAEKRTKELEANIAQLNNTLAQVNERMKESQQKVAEFDHIVKERDWAAQELNEQKKRDWELEKENASLHIDMEQLQKEFSSSKPEIERLQKEISSLTENEAVKTVLANPKLISRIAALIKKKKYPEVDPDREISDPDMTAQWLRAVWTDMNHASRFEEYQPVLKNFMDVTHGLLHKKIQGGQASIKEEPKGRSVVGDRTPSIFSVANPYAHLEKRRTVHATPAKGSVDITPTLLKRPAEQTRGESRNAKRSKNDPAPH